MRAALLAFLTLTPVIAPTAAVPDDFKIPEESLGGYRLVLATVDDLESARAEAYRAAHVLGRAVQEHTLRKPIDELARTPSERLPWQVRSWDGSITVHRTDSKRFQIIGGGGSREAMLKGLARAQPHFPTARVEWSRHVMDGYHWHGRRGGILIAGSFRSYDAALRAAKDVAAVTGLKDGTHSMVYDDERGLILPDSANGPWAGRYVSRRDDECGDGRGNPRAPCVTVELSSAYDGFEPGYFIVVAGVMWRSAERNLRLEQVREVVPDAYVKETTLYLGCRA